MSDPNHYNIDEYDLLVQLTNQLIFHFLRSNEENLSFSPSKSALEHENKTVVHQLAIYHDYFVPIDQ